MTVLVDFQAYIMHGLARKSFSVTASIFTYFRFPTISYHDNLIALPREVLIPSILKEISTTYGHRNYP